MCWLWNLSFQRSKVEETRIFFRSSSSPWGCGMLPQRVIEPSPFSTGPWIFGDVQIQSCWTFSCWKPYSKSSVWFLSQIFLYVFPSRALVCSSNWSQFGAIHEQKSGATKKRYSRRITDMLLMANQIIPMHNMYPLVMTNSLLLRMAREIVSFPIHSMVILHSLL